MEGKRRRINLSRLEAMEDGQLEDLAGNLKEKEQKKRARYAAQAALNELRFKGYQDYVAEVSSCVEAIIKARHSGANSTEKF